MNRQKNLNPKAVALKYEPQIDSAPKVVAKGEGEVAKKIIQKAKEFSIPIFQNEALAESLLKVDLDNQIPYKLYEAVVEVFIWLQKSQKKAQLSSN